MDNKQSVGGCIFLQLWIYMSEREQIYILNINGLLNHNLPQGEFILPQKLKWIHLLQENMDKRLRMSYRGASSYSFWG